MTFLIVLTVVVTIVAAALALMVWAVWDEDEGEED